jgi:hypothetical protein
LKILRGQVRNWISIGYIMCKNHSIYCSNFCSYQLESVSIMWVLWFGEAKFFSLVLRMRFYLWGPRFLHRLLFLMLISLEVSCKWYVKKEIDWRLHWKDWNWLEIAFNKWKNKVKISLSFFLWIQMKYVIFIKSISIFKLIFSRPIFMEVFLNGLY